MHFCIPDDDHISFLYYLFILLKKIFLLKMIISFFRFVDLYKAPNGTWY